MKTLSTLQVPQASWSERIWLWVNMLPFAVSLVLRTVLWYFKVPFGRLWSRPTTLVACSWQAGDLDLKTDRLKEPMPERPLEGLWDAILQRQANTLPHTHGELPKTT